jgi:hypothetical protein
VLTLGAYGAMHLAVDNTQATCQRALAAGAIQFAA